MQPKTLLAAAALLSSTASAFVMPASWEPAADRAAVDHHHHGPRPDGGFHALPFDVDADVADDDEAGETSRRIRFNGDRVELAVPYATEADRGALLLDISVPKVWGRLLVNDAVLYSTRDGEVEDEVRGELQVHQADVVLTGDAAPPSSWWHKVRKGLAGRKGRKGAKAAPPELARCIRPGVCVADAADLPNATVAYTLGRQSRMFHDGRPGPVVLTLALAGVAPRVSLHLLRPAGANKLFLDHVEVAGEGAQWVARLPPPGSHLRHGGGGGSMLSHPPMAPPAEIDGGAGFLPAGLKDTLDECDSLLCRWRALTGAARRKMRPHCGGGMRGLAGSDKDRVPSFPPPPPPPFHRPPHHGEKDHPPPPPPFGHPPPPPPFSHPPHHGEEDHPPPPPPPPFHHPPHHGEEDYPPPPPPPPFHHPPHHGEEDHDRRPPHHKGHKDHKDHEEHEDHEDKMDHKDHKGHAHPHHHHHHDKEPLGMAFLANMPSMLDVFYIVLACVAGSIVGRTLQRLVRQVFPRKRVPDAEERGAVDEKAGLMAADAQQTDSELPPYADAVSEKTVV